MLPDELGGGVLGIFCVMFWRFIAGMNGNDVLCGMNLRHMLMNEVRFGRIANKG